MAGRWMVVWDPPRSGRGWGGSMAGWAPEPPRGLPSMVRAGHRPTAIAGCTPPGSNSGAHFPYAGGTNSSMDDRKGFDEEFLPLERAKLFIGRESGQGVKTSFQICNKPFTEIFGGQPLKSSSRYSGTNPSTLRKSATLEAFVPADRLLVWPTGDSLRFWMADGRDGGSREVERMGVVWGWAKCVPSNPDSRPDPPTRWGATMGRTLGCCSPPPPADRERHRLARPSRRARSS